MSKCQRLLPSTIEIILEGACAATGVPIEAITVDHLDRRAALKSAIFSLREAGASWPAIAEILGYGLHHQGPMRAYRAKTDP